MWFRALIMRALAPVGLLLIRIAPVAVTHEIPKIEDGKPDGAIPLDLLDMDQLVAPQFPLMNMFAQDVY